MNPLIVIAFVALLGGVAGGAAVGWMAAPAQPAVAARVSDLAAAAEKNMNPVAANEQSQRAELLEERLVALEQALYLEQQSSLEFQRKLADLSEQLEQAENALSQQPASVDGDEIAASSTLSNDNLAVTEPQASAPAFSQTSVRRALVQAGIDQLRADELVALRDQRELAELELRDQAAREGWLEQEDFDELLEQRLPAAVDLKAELEPVQWESYLYHRGRPNQVHVSRVLNGSSAQQAGILNGDRIVRYAGEPIYSMRELQTSIRDGQRGETVTVEIERDGTRQQITVLRGPLGITMEPQRVNPDAGLPDN